MNDSANTTAAIVVLIALAVPGVCVLIAMAACLWEMRK